MAGREGGEGGGGDGGGGGGGRGAETNQETDERGINKPGNRRKAEKQTSVWRGGCGGRD